MKSYLSLVPISAHVHKRRNIMTLICIVLAVFLVTAVFSMADMAIRMERIRAIDQHGSWHIMLKNVSDKDAQLIALRPDTDVVSIYDSLNSNIKKDWYIGKKKAALCTMDREWTEDIFHCLTAGSFPVESNEALLTENAKDILDVDIGGSFKMDTPQGSFTYTVTGFIKESSALRYDAVVVCVTRSEFERLCGILGSEDSDPVYYVRFKEGINIRRAIENIKREYGYTDENISENTALMGLTGFSTSSYMIGLYGIAFMLFLLVLTAGIFMIAGSMNSDVARRIEFFGMLRCIGAEKKQIMRIVRLEALNRCKTAVPFGVLLGTLVSWLLCAVMKFGIGGELEDIPIFQISYVGIIFGMIVGIVTVLLASVFPAKRAAGVSPITAVTGNTRAHSIGKSLLGIETALGINNALSSKKNIFLMTGSFALSIILFLSFSVLVDWTHRALNPLLPSAPDVSVMSSDRKNTVDRELIYEIGGKPGVKLVYGRMFRGNMAIVPYKDIKEVDIISYDSCQFNWAEGYMLEGDISKALQGNYMLSVYDRTNPLKTGDKFQIGNTQIEVAGILSADIPFEVTEGIPLMICSEQLFTNLTGEKDYAVIDVQIDKNISHEDLLAIRSAAGSDRLFSDRRETNKEITDTYITFSILVYSFVGIIAMIALFNIMNSISMSVNAAKKKYGIMRAVGMSRVQIIKMIAAEAVTYAFFGCITGCVLGSMLNKYMFDKIIGAYFGDAWKMPVQHIAVSIAFILLCFLLAVYFPSRHICEASVVDVIYEE